MPKASDRLRVVPQPTDTPPPDDVAGSRLRALREAHTFSPGTGLAHRTGTAPALTQEQLSKLTYEAAEKSGGRLRGLGRTYIVNIEAGRNDAQTDRVRAVFAAVYGLTRDQLADYLDGVVTLQELLGAQSRPATPGPAKAPPPPVGAPAAGTHKRWKELVDEVRKLEPGIRDATFAAIAESPFPYGDLNKIDAYVLAKVAVAVQSYLDRSGGP
jgi:hypothetical protein